MSPEPKTCTAVSRRQALTLGGGLVAGGALASALPASAATADNHSRRLRRQHGHLPVHGMEEILNAQGTVSQGVLSVEISRDDIGDVKGPLGVTFTPAFEVNGTLTFQPLGDHWAFFNGDLALKPAEVNPFIDAILANGLTFQALHQHYIETHPNIWFIHWRGEGGPHQLARAVKRVLKATSTPFPQQPPAHPTTPLDPDKLASILHGTADVGDEGVVTVTVSRTDRIVIGDVLASPEANIFVEIQFKPLAPSGAHAAAGPDFGMIAEEIDPVVRLMRRHGWFQGCLYNQESDEHPQLYFDHMLKVGNAYELAHEIRRGLNLMNVE